MLLLLMKGSTHGIFGIRDAAGLGRYLPSWDVDAKNRQTLMYPKVEYARFEGRELIAARDLA